MSDALTSHSSSEPAVTEAPNTTEAPASSPAPDATSAPSSGADDQTGASSAPNPVSERDGLLAAVKDAIAPRDANPNPAAATSAAVSDPAAPVAAPPAAEPDPTDADLAGYKPAARKYIGKLTTQRNEARDQLKSLEPELAAHRQLTGYLRQHQLAADDVNALLGVGAALRRGDMQAFLNGIEPYRELALQSLGKALPADLQAQVDQGTVSQEIAAELTRTRMAAARDQTEVQVQRQTMTQRETDTRQRETASAVTSWEQGTRARDPDYALKEAMVLRTSQAILAAEGTPQSSQDAVRMVQRAYDEVNAAFARTRQAPQATRRTPAGVSTPSLGAQPEPRNMMEAVKLGLVRAGARA